jgi:hypothetical protein
VTSSLLSRVVEGASEELGRRNRSLAVRPAGDHFCVEREQNGAEVGGRVGVDDGAADRAAVAHLWITDVLRCPSEDRAVPGENRVAGEVGVAGERADRNPVAILAHVTQIAEPADVD